MLSKELLSYYRQVSQQTLTVVDVETTGSIATTNRITEISVLQATLAEGVLHQQTDLINPQTPIPEKIVQFTGITQEMVNEAPVAADVLPSYLRLLGEGVLTAHNLEFDYPFLRAEFARIGKAFIRPEDQQLCTVQLSRLMLPDLPSRSLPNLVKYFRFKVGKSHRAEADTLACWLLAKRLLTEIVNEPDELLLARFAKQRIPLKYAAKLLGCSSKTAQSRLEAAGVHSRKVGRGRDVTMMYQRGEVEQFFYDQQGDGQLSLM